MTKRHLQADCQETGSALEPYARVWATLPYLTVYDVMVYDTMLRQMTSQPILIMADPAAQLMSKDGNKRVHRQGYLDLA